MTNNQDKRTWVVWDRNTREIIRVVEAKHPDSLPMQGPWSNQWNISDFKKLVEKDSERRDQVTELRIINEKLVNLLKKIEDMIFESTFIGEPHA